MSTLDTVHGVLDEVGRFMADVVAPTNRDGDRIGSVWNPDYTVTTPESFKLAYKQYVRTGYGAVPFDPEFGGGGFPWVTAIAMQEMLTSANMALSLCPLLTQGAIEAVSHHGSDELRHDVPAQDADRRMAGHDEPHRAPGRQRRRCRAHPS